MVVDASQEYYLMKGHFGLVDRVDPFNASMAMSHAVMESEDKLGVIRFFRSELDLLEDNVMGLYSILGKKQEG